MAYLQPFNITVSGTDTNACSTTSEVWSGIACLCDGVPGPAGTNCDEFTSVDWVSPNKNYTCDNKDSNNTGT